MSSELYRQSNPCIFLFKILYNRLYYIASFSASGIAAAVVCFSNCTLLHRDRQVRSIYYSQLKDPKAITKVHQIYAAALQARSFLALDYSCRPDWHARVPDMHASSAECHAATACTVQHQVHARCIQGMYVFFGTLVTCMYFCMFSLSICSFVWLSL